jgi:3-phenylpropionate/cinnamic acid dioxygenase small subunit
MSTAHVTNLISRIAHLADEGELQEYVDCFAEDAVWELRSATAAGAQPDRRVGRADIAEGVVTRREAGMQGPGTHTRHVITTVEVVSETATTAAVISYWQFYVHTAATPTLAAMGRYDDELRRDEDGTWRLAARHITSG